MKRIICIAFISIACCFSFLTGYFSLYSVPVYGAQDDWETLTSNEQLVDAFKVYCKSRNTVIDGSLLDAVTSFTTTTFNNICNTLGIDMTLLQAEIQRRYSGTGYKYAFSSSGLSGFNRIFAEFLQNNDLSVGDEVDNKSLYEGEYFTSLDGHGAFVYYPISNIGYSGTQQKYNGDIYEIFSKLGSTFIYDSQNMSEYYTTGFVSPSYSITNSLNVTFTFTHKTSYDADILEVNTNLYSFKRNFFRSQSGTYPNNYYYGKLIIYKNPDGTLGCGLTWERLDGTIAFYSLFYITGSEATPCDIYVTTNNNIINNETVINEGDTIIYNNDGTPDSGGGGSGGDDDPDQGDDWNPVLPDVPPAGSDPSGGNTIDWPDIDLPDFGLSNFSLGDLRLKFPFSIPFDIVSILGVINAPAVAPAIHEDIPIRIDLMNVDYTMPIDLDMSDTLYDNFAVLVRAVEFIGFCIGLIHLTIRLVKG